MKPLLIIFLFALTACATPGTGINWRYIKLGGARNCYNSTCGYYPGYWYGNPNYGFHNAGPRFYPAPIPRIDIHVAPIIIPQLPRLGQ